MLAISCFNSMIVRLKVFYQTKHKRFVPGFNSMIVRLKGICNISVWHMLRGFNSMIVRLKVSITICRVMIATKFQFYDSPIKSSVFNIEQTNYPGFNSMIVRLKVLNKLQSLHNNMVSIL